MDRPMRPFARPVAGVFLAYLAGLAANLVVSILVARTMGAAGSGVIALALVGPNILALLGNLGLPGAISHFLRSRDADPRRLVATAFATAAAAGLVLMAAYMLLGGPLGRWLQTSDQEGGPYELTRGLLMLAAMVVPLEILLQCLMAAFQGRQEFARRSGVLLAYRWLYVALAAAGVLAIGAEPRVVILAGVTAYAATGVAGCAVLFRRLRSTGQAGADRARARDLLGYAWRTHVAAVLVFLILRSDLFLVKALLGDAAEVGLYSKAVQVAEVVLYFLLALEGVLFPRMSGLPRAEIPAAAAALVRRGLLAGGVLVVAFELLAPWLIRVPFGDAFAGSIGPLRLMLPAALAVGLARAVFAVFNAMERPWIPAAVAAGGLVLIVALDLLWIPALGIRGAALASLATYAAMALCMLALLARAGGLPLAALVFPRRADLRAVTGLLRRRAAPPDDDLISPDEPLPPPQ